MVRLVALTVLARECDLPLPRLQVPAVGQHDTGDGGGEHGERARRLLPRGCRPATRAGQPMPQRPWAVSAVLSALL